MADDLKTQGLDSILADDLEAAGNLLASCPPELEQISLLLKKVKGKQFPLVELKTAEPRVIGTSVSYTCGIGCQMCSSGFADRTSLFDDYKYLTPQEFDALGSFLKSASHVYLSGLGETLDSPHIYDFLKNLEDKTTFLFTSGVSLTGEKARKLIDSGLDYLVFSFDGNTSAGHGSGNNQYTERFWEKVRLLQAVKNGLNNLHPIGLLSIILTHENVDQLDAIITRAYAQGIEVIQIGLMIPISDALIEKSIFKDYETVKKKVNAVLKKWEGKSRIDITLLEKNRLTDQTGVCQFVDKFLIFNLNRHLPYICCGPILMPMETGNLSPEKYWNSFPFRYFRYLHFHSEYDTLPQPCKTCVYSSPKKFADTIGSWIPGSGREKEITLYQTASRLKQEGRVEEAAERFQKAVALTNDPALKGKAYFHLGAMEIDKGNYPQALKTMKQAVQQCFDHKMAFACLYLLFMLLERPGALKPMRGADMTYLDKLAEYSKQQLVPL